MTFETIEAVLTSGCYQRLGQSVTYNGQGEDSSTIYAIVDIASTPFGLNTTTPESVSTARVRSVDVARPRRYDRITMADGTVYVVDGVEELNNVEYSLTLTECDK